MVGKVLVHHAEYLNKAVTKEIDRISIAKLIFQKTRVRVKWLATLMKVTAESRGYHLPRT